MGRSRSRPVPGAGNSGMALETLMQAAKAVRRELRLELA
jgi:hypothetical protein